MHSPRNVQDWIAFGVLLLIAWRAQLELAPKSRYFQRFPQAILPATIVFGTTLLLFAPWLSTGFLSDDFIHIELAASAKSLENFLATGDGFFRPIGYLSLAITATVAGKDPVLWHLFAILLHGINSLVLFVFLYELCGRRQVAVLGALLFALHGSRPESVIWIAGRFDLIATTFVLVTLWTFIRWEKRNRRSSYLLALFTCLLALLSKEVAYVTPALLLLLSIYRSHSVTEAFKSTFPFWFLTGVLFVFRYWWIGGIGGYLDPATSQPEIFAVRLVDVARILVLRVWAVMIFPLNWSSDTHWLVALILLFYLAAWIILMLKIRLEKRIYWISAAFVLISSLPAVQLLLIGSDLRGARLLYLPSVGFALLFAALLQGQGLSRGMKRLIAVTVLVFNFAALTHNARIWKDVSELAERTCRQAALIIERQGSSAILVRDLPGTIDGVFFFRNGFAECVSRYLESEKMPAIKTLPPGSDYMTTLPDDADQLIWNGKELFFLPGSE